MTLPAGTRVGPYEVLGLIGAGGMGEVYRARDGKLQREVAIKILPAAFAGDPDRLARFEREAQVLASLNHPNIATIHGFEQSADGLQALVLELVEGPTLADRIAQGPIPLDEALPITRQIADALEAAHEQGIIHRDLKPANIKLRPDGTVKVLDFGLAKLVEARGASGVGGVTGLSMSPTITSPAMMTAGGVILGTAAYMSPEQARGKPVDRRSDIWAFGCVLYEMLTGRRPFEGPEITDVLARVLERDIDLAALPAETPPSIRRTIERCLVKDPRNRLPHIGIVRLEAQDARQNEPRAPAADTSRGRVRERIAWAAAGLLAVVAASAWPFATFRTTAAPAQLLRFAVLLPQGMNLFDMGASQGSPVALSRDSHQLALIAVDERGERHLVVRPIDVLAGSVLPGTEGASAPFWSPDGRWVAFFANGKLKKVPATGGPVEVIADSGPGGGGTWNGDDTILFSPADAGEGGLVRVAAAGGSPTAVTTLDKRRGETNYLWPQFLPDGRHFLFFLGGGEGQGVYIGSLDAPDRVPVITAASLNFNYTMPVYAAGRLFFIRDRTLFAQPFDADRLVLRGEPTRIAEDVATGGPGSSIFCVTDDALVLQNSIAPDTIQLTWVTRDGERLSTVGEPLNAYGVRLSPDERRIGVVRYDPTARMWPSAIWVTDATRGAASRFTFTWGADNPVWSLDGRRIVFARVGELGPPQIVRKAADGSGAEEVLFKGISSTGPTDWAPEGSIVYAAMDNDTKYDVWRLSADNPKTPTRLLGSPFNELDARVSPNGKWMAFVSDESGRNEVYVTAFPAGGDKQQISLAGGAQVDWSRDGRELFFVAGDGRLTAVRVRSDAAFEFGPATTLFEIYKTVNPWWHTYAVSNDGSKFLVMTREGTQAPSPPVQVIVNWSALLRH